MKSQVIKLLTSTIFGLLINGSGETAFAATYEKKSYLEKTQNYYYNESGGKSIGPLAIATASLIILSIVISVKGKSTPKNPEINNTEVNSSSTEHLLKSINRKLKEIEQEIETTLSKKEDYFPHPLAINSETVFVLSTEDLIKSINTELEEIESEIEISISKKKDHCQNFLAKGTDG